MIVLDASAAVDLLLNLPPHTKAIAQRVAKTPAIAAPHLLDAEVGQALRRLVHAGKIDEATALAALADLADLPITRYAHGPLLPGALALRNNVTVYDAIYLVLAEALGATLLTCHGALEKVPGQRAKVHVL